MQPCRPHRPPPSFPTRRSSDLARGGGAGGSRARGAGGSGRSEEEARRHRYREPRSEEHTSELQSLRHLVCRLLLEKKKNLTVRFHETTDCGHLHCLRTENFTAL